MGKINWTRVVLGGLIAGVVGIVFLFAVWVPLVGPSLKAALVALGHPMEQAAGTTVLTVVWNFLAGILLIWLYAAIRPRYGAGPGTAALVGVAAGLLIGVFPDTFWGLSLRLIPARVWVGDAIVTLVGCVVATVLGAWVYKEEAA